MHPAAWAAALALHLGVLAAALHPAAAPPPRGLAFSVGLAGVAGGMEGAEAAPEPPPPEPAEAPSAMEPPPPEPFPTPELPASRAPPPARVEARPPAAPAARPAPRAPTRAATPAPQTQPGPAIAPSPASAAPPGAAAGQADPGAARDGRAAPLPPGYAQTIAAILRRHLRYPPAARSMGVEGEALVRFAIGRDGTIGAAQLVGGSGFVLLDHEAMALLRRVSPLPPLPPEVPGATATVQVPIRFSLR